MNSRDSGFRLMLAVVTAAAIFLLIWFATDVLLTIFGGILFAIFLRALADLLSNHTGLSGGKSLAIVVAALTAIVAGGLYFMLPRVSAQFDNMLIVLPDTLEQWVAHLNRYDWGKWVVAQMPDLGRALLAKLNIMRLFTGMLRGLVFAVVVAFIGLYVAARPRLYRDGALRLLPAAKRTRAQALFISVGETMRSWMIGRSIAMVSVGVLDWIGLMLLGFPLALSIAVLSGVLTFIPYVGAIISLLPAVIIALGISPSMAFWVIVIHTGVQTIEGYVITPLVQRRAVHLPPALTIAAQFFLGQAVGVLGLMFATPLAAITLVVLRDVYFNDREE